MCAAVGSGWVSALCQEVYDQEEWEDEDVQEGLVAEEDEDDVIVRSDSLGWGCGYRRGRKA